MLSQVDKKHELQLSVIDGYIEEAEKDGYCASVTLHALKVMRNRYEELMLAQEDIKMLCHWASHLVGNNQAFNTACEAWQKSFKQLISK
jgi:hypothetical protein